MGFLTRSRSLNSVDLLRNSEWDYLGWAWGLEVLTIGSWILEDRSIFTGRRGLYIP
jgi:hypothetical protein